MSKERWNPGRLFALSGSYWSAFVLHAAVKLDVFSQIGDGRAASAEVAAELESDPRGTAMLLDALAALGLLEKQGGRYANTAEARDLLCKDSPDYLGHIILHHHHLVDGWSNLDAAVRSGRPQRGDETFTQEHLESFLMGMFNLAMALAPQVAAGIDLTGRKRLLDLGGGPGTYAIHFCMSCPELAATVYDLPTTRPFAEKTIARFGLSERVDFQEGNFHDDVPVRGAFDVAWLSQVLHAEGPDGCAKILRKAVSALEPGGVIFVHEFILNDERSAPLFPALFSLNMLLATERGQAYSEKEIIGLLADAGVREIWRLPFRGPSDSGIIAGVRR